MSSDLSPGMRAMAARVSGDDYAAWRRQVERVKFCSRPVRVAGRASAVDPASGEVQASFSSADQPDGTLLIACGDRRASVCPSCAETYRRDMWHVVVSGLQGRTSATSSGAHAGVRGAAVETAVPSSVASHPRLFVTLTAPSFGPVHRDAGGAACRPRSGRGRTCAHGRPAGCGLVHEAGHQVIGAPLCPECYDYIGAVLWNSACSELWRRTRIGIDRALAPVASEVTGNRVTVAGVRALLRVSYVKVAEFQRRGLVHLHLVVRLDGVDPTGGGEIVAPPVWATADLLASAVRRAVGAAAVPLPSPDGTLRVAQWGSQFDVSDISAGGPVGDGRRLAAYVAKYATKTAGDAIGASGVLASRFRRLHRTWLRRRIGRHLARMVETAWDLGGRPDLAHLRLRQWAHSLGYRGHFATKSRRYSVTLGALRAARRVWRAGESVRAGRADVWASARGSGAAVVGDWAYVGRGYRTSSDADLAAAMARDHAIAVEEYRDLKRRESDVDYWSTLSHYPGDL
ncbi:hypothetical protein CLV63_1632 [Murinocardiopsis flavida]|uniref:Replication initiation protein n=1 Tax=Murinocardiopsis flavida TaxID=645275 RepID=A0A2P8C5F5_9ACTN|nr:replication initiator [Murinocardiopsis flavida]PSK80176.1 hypothetical protein CLV63_1632 [Murinocardiopsis flavida]